MNGEEIFNYKYSPLRNHMQGYKIFASKYNIPLSFTSNESSALGLISRGYISMEFLRTPFEILGCILYLPIELTNEQIEYVDRYIPYLKRFERDRKVLAVGIYSPEPLYYNNKKYRDLTIEASMNNLLVSDMLKEELEKQKGKSL